MEWTTIEIGPSAQRTEGAIGGGHHGDPQQVVSHRGCDGVHGGVGAIGPDSAFFSYGLGLIVSSGDSAIVYTPFTPVILEGWNKHAEPLQMAPTPDIEVAQPNLDLDGSSRDPRYEIATGLVILDGFLFLSAYDSETDISSLWQIDKEGGITMAKFPLRLRIRSGSDSVFIASRRLGREEVGFYRLREFSDWE